MDDGSAPKHHVNQHTEKLPTLAFWRQRDSSDFDSVEYLVMGLFALLDAIVARLCRKDGDFVSLRCKMPKDSPEKATVRSRVGPVMTIDRQNPHLDVSHTRLCLTIFQAVPLGCDDSVPEVSKFGRS